MVGVGDGEGKVTLDDWLLDNAIQEKQEREGNERLILVVVLTILSLCAILGYVVLHTAHMI